MRFSPVLAPLLTSTFCILPQLIDASPTTSGRETVPPIIFTVSPALPNGATTFELPLDRVPEPPIRGVSELYVLLDSTTLQGGTTLETASFTGGPPEADQVLCAFYYFLPPERGGVNMVDRFLPRDDEGLFLGQVGPFHAGDVVSVEEAAIIECRAVIFDH